MTDMSRLPESLAAWGGKDFSATLKREIMSLGVLRTLLARCINRFGAIDDPITVMVLGADDRGKSIEARMFILFSLVEMSYHCPVGHVADSVFCACGVTAHIDKSNAETTFVAASDAE